MTLVICEKWSQVKSKLTKFSSLGHIMLGIKVFPNLVFIRVNHNNEKAENSNNRTTKTKNAASGNMYLE